MESNSQSKWIGKRLGKYNVQKLLGSGAMGAVFQAYNTLLEKTVCLKILSPALVSLDQKTVDRFLREARSVARLDHPNIVRVYDIEEAQGAYFIVMEYIEGKSLAQLLDEKDAFAVRETLQIGIQVGEALVAAHEEGIIHRDVKPANIMISRGHQIKLTDFGLAISMGNTGISAEGEVFGTPFYLAPEYINSETLDKRVDMYSLGITLYHMLAGNLPYKGKTPIETIQKHLNAPIPSIRKVRPDVSVKLDRVISKLMAKNPEERPATAREVVVALTNCERQMAEEQNEETLRFAPEQISHLRDKYKNGAPQNQTGKVRVLVAEADPVMREAICGALHDSVECELAGAAPDGETALKMVPDTAPDVITLNAFMPQMDGVTAIKHIMIRRPRPVIVVSEFSYEGIVSTFDCLSCGAVDFLWTSPKNRPKFREKLLEKIKSAARVRLKVPAKLRSGKSIGAKELPRNPAQWIIIAGAGEGGYHTSLKIIPYIPKNVPCAIILIQKMPNELVKVFSNYLNHHSKIVVKSIAHKEPLIEGVCYVANHLSGIEIERFTGGYRILKKGNGKNGVFGKALSCAAESCGNRAIGLVLSGSGKNAIEGLKKFKKSGGVIIVQDPDTCLQPAASRMAIENGVANKVVEDKDIASVLWHLLKRKTGYSLLTRKLSPQDVAHNTLVFVSGALSANGLQQHLKQYDLLQFSGFKEFTSCLRMFNARVILDSDYLDSSLVNYLNLLKSNFPETRLLILADASAKIEEPEPIVSLPYNKDENKLAQLLLPYLSGFYFKAGQLSFELVLFLAHKGEWTAKLCVNKGTAQEGMIELRQGKTVQVKHKELQGSEALLILLQHDYGWQIME